MMKKYVQSTIQVLVASISIHFSTLGGRKG